MALMPCRECGAQVSTSAEVCPHCGIRSPASSAASSNQASVLDSKEKKRRGKGGFIVIGLTILFVGGWAASKAISNSEQTMPSCQSDWTRCADNADVANNYRKWSDVKVDCKMQADKQARYGHPAWPWLYFGAYYSGNSYISSGIAVAIEPDAQFQNGFGAMVHSTVRCTYDLRAQRVISVDVSAK